MSNRRNSPSVPAPSRSLPLDVLRGLAILLVLMHHCVIPTSQAGAIAPVARALYCVGWTGVDLFFVLSGFLVGGLLLDEARTRGSLDAGRFLLRRMLKIWPPYYALLLYVFVFESLYHARAATVARQLLPNVVHVQNYFTTLRAHTWSLAVEEHFYLLLPLVIAWTARRRTSLIPVLAIGCMIACAAWRVADRVFGWHEALYFRTQFRLDGLFCGVLLAWTARHRPSVMAWASRRRALLIALGIALVSPMLFLDKDSDAGFVLSVGFTLLYLGYGCMVLAAATMDTPWTHRLPRAIGFVGLYSYSIYLWFEDLARTPIGALVRRGALDTLPPSLRFVTAQLAYIVLAVAMGALGSLAVERPMLKVRDRLFPSRLQTKGARP